MLQETGRIEGSVSITGDGEVYLAVRLDVYELLINLSVVKGHYTVDMAAIETNDTAKTSDFHEATLGNNIDDVTQNILLWLAPLQLSKETILSIPYALQRAWRSPKESSDAVYRMASEHQEA